MASLADILRKAVADWDARYPPSRGYVEVPWVTEARAAFSREAPSPQSEAQPSAGKEALDEPLPHPSPDRGGETAYLQGARDAIGPIAQFLHDYFAPWGAWKTEWWEHLTSDRPFNDAEALAYLHKLVKVSAPPPQSGER